MGRGQAVEHRFGPTRAESTLLPQSPGSATQRAPATPPLPRGPGRPLRAPWRVGQPHQRPGRGIRADYQVGYGCGVPHGAPGRREGGLTDVAEKDENLSWRFLCMWRLVTTTGAHQTKPRVQIRSFRVSVATDVLLVARLEEKSVRGHRQVVSIARAEVASGVGTALPTRTLLLVRSPRQALAWRRAVSLPRTSLTR